jgi:hypothetical protein
VRTPQQILAAELMSLHGDLGEVLEHVIGSRISCEFHLENFQDALVKLRGVRICLDYEANKLSPRPTDSEAVST